MTFVGVLQITIKILRKVTLGSLVSWHLITLLYINRILLLKLPSAMPNLFTGLKLAATYSVMGAVIGEWLGGNAGLGIYLIRATKSYKTAQVFAVILVIVLLSMMLYGVVAILERVLLAWNYRREDEFVEPDQRILNS